MCHLWSECQFFKCGAPLPKENTNKYHAEKTVIDNIRFDSKREAVRWAELRLMERTGQISNLERQKPYELIPAQKDANGKVLFRACNYIADFVYQDTAGQTIIEDCKGMRTEVYKIKKKLMYSIYHILIKET